MAITLSSIGFKIANRVWVLIPGKLRKTRLITAIKIKMMNDLFHENRSFHSSIINTSPVNAAKAGDAVKVKVVSSIKELDEVLASLDAAAAISDDELRKAFKMFEMKYILDVPNDPDSGRYRANQWKLYELLHGEPYSVQNEISNFDVVKALDAPFPFCTKSPETVGNDLIASGYLIQKMSLKPGAKIIEFGPGWGNTTLWLAQMGYMVTAVDIEERFIDLISQRAKRTNLVINAIRGDFSLVHELKETFDAVLFFKSFHHCSNHQKLISGLQSIVARDGKVVFAAEPIDDGFPLPWGLRLDGESLWAIRKNGWLELGFQERYFRELMKKNGWGVEKHICSDTPWGVIFIATRLVQ